MKEMISKIKGLRTSEKVFSIGFAVSLITADVLLNFEKTAAGIAFFGVTLMSAAGLLMTDRKARESKEKNI
ncbi:MAG: hypothetical protein IJ806_09385 [Ruminococcus sp.]|nr:hypothetical protein [Ruminococcus sp.]